MEYHKSQAPPIYGQPPSSPPNYNHGTLPPPPSYNQTPPPTGIPVETFEPWSSGLCDCCSDVPVCCITCWCPCITFGQVAEIVDEGSTSCGASGALYFLLKYLTGCAFILSTFKRREIRNQYMLAEQPFSDCAVHFFCEPCALCQEYRELRHRGFDMTLGWHGNLDKQNKSTRKAPFVEGGMNR